MLSAKAQHGIVIRAQPGTNRYDSVLGMFAAIDLRLRRLYCGPASESIGGALRKGTWLAVRNQVTASGLLADIEGVLVLASKPYHPFHLATG